MNFNIILLTYNQEPRAAHTLGFADITSSQGHNPPTAHTLGTAD